MDRTALLAIIATVGAVGGLSGAIWYLFFRPDRTAAERIAAFTGADEAPRIAPSGAVSAVTRTAARLSTTDDVDELAALRKKLGQAGFRNRDAVLFYNALRTLLLLCFGALGFLFMRNSQITYLLFAVLLGATFGYYLPHLYVTNLVIKRQLELLRGFPDALDLLVSCVEAGLGLDIAFRRVADEMSIGAPELSRELQLVTAEVAAGVPRAEALRHLAERTGLDELLSLVNVLVQAERFGTSVARALRVHSEHVRVRRMQKAEEKAAQVSPKLTIIMIVFILPCLMVVLMAPALLRVKSLFGARNSQSSTQ